MQARQYPSTFNWSLPLVICTLREVCRRFGAEKSLQIRLSALKIKMKGVIA